MGKAIVIGGADFSSVSVKKIALGEMELFYTNYTPEERETASTAVMRTDGLHGYIVRDVSLAGKVVAQVSLYIKNSSTLPLYIYKRNITTNDPKELLAVFKPSDYTSPGEYDISVGAISFGENEYLEFSGDPDTLPDTNTNSFLAVNATGGNTMVINSSYDTGVVPESQARTIQLLYKVYTIK